MAMTDEQVVEKFTACYSEAQSAWSKIHEEALEDKRFVQLGEQDAEGEDSSGRARIRINKMMSFIKQVTNEMKQTNISIRLIPVDNGADVNRAKVRQGVVRGIERRSNATLAYQYAGEEQVTCGLGAFRVCTHYASDKSFDQMISVKRIIDATKVFYGPASEPDFSDAEYCIVQGAGQEYQQSDEKYGWLKADKEREKIYGEPKRPNEFEFWWLEKADDKLYQHTNGRLVYCSQVAEGADPSIFVQKDGKRLERKTIRRQWWCYKIKAGEVIEKTEWPGRYCPVVMVLGREVWVDGERKLLSLIRFSKDSQRMYNYARSAAAESLNRITKAPWVVAVESIPKKFESLWQKAHRVAVGMLPFKAYTDDGKTLPAPTRPSAVGIDPAIVQEALTSNDEMKATTGIHDASLGARGNETSGIAIRARQREGDVSTYDFQSNLNTAIRHCGRIINDLIPKVIDTKRQIVMVGEDDSETVIEANADSELAQTNYGGKDSFYLNEDEEYDIAVEVGASYSTKRLENSENLLELMRVSPIAAQALPNLYVKQLDFDLAQKAAEQIERLMPPGVVEDESKNGKMPPQAIQAIQQLEQMQAAMGEMQKAFEGLKADMTLKSREIDIKEYEAKTRRFEVETKFEAEGIKAKSDVLKERISANASVATAAITARAGGPKGQREAQDSRDNME